MYRRIGIILVSLITALYFCILHWLNVPTHALVNSCTIKDLVKDPSAMNKAIDKMGPYYQYKVSVDGRLYVNKGDGNWLRLRYKNHNKCPVVGDVP